MIAELFMNNAFNLTVILSCCAALVLMSVWYHRGERRCKGFIFHAALIFCLCHYHWDVWQHC